MGNVTLPTPIFVAGGALCLLAGYFVGSIAGPDTPERTTGTVASFDQASNALCLTGETIAEQEGVDENGELCGTWRRTNRSAAPAEGDTFRFVSVRLDGETEDEPGDTLIYGDVVD